MNLRVYGTGVDFVILQWTISRLVFTPETYYIEYTELYNGESTTTNPDVTIQYPVVNTNFSAVDVEYTFVVNGLEASSVYSVIVVAANSIGETRPLEYISFETRDEGTYHSIEQHKC